MRVVLRCVIGLCLLGSVSEAKAFEYNPLNWDWSLNWRVDPPRWGWTRESPLKWGFNQDSIKGNDTGGIIAWTPENEPQAKAWATAFCKQYNKYPRITGVQRQLGNYISFNCLWTPYVARYALPEVRLRGEAPVLTK
jgi:hypothetical protein